MFKNLFKKRKMTENIFSVDLSCFCENFYSGIKVERVAYRPFYDSEWKITTPHFSAVIIRNENEEAENLLKVIESLPVYTEEEIKKLDERNKIWYD